MVAPALLASAAACWGHMSPDLSWSPVCGSVDGLSLHPLCLCCEELQQNMLHLLRFPGKPLSDLLSQDNYVANQDLASLFPGEISLILPGHRDWSSGSDHPWFLSICPGHWGCSGSHAFTRPRPQQQGLSTCRRWVRCSWTWGPHPPGSPTPHPVSGCSSFLCAAGVSFYSSVKSSLPSPSALISSSAAEGIIVQTQQGGSGPDRTRLQSCLHH